MAIQDYMRRMAEGFQRYMEREDEYHNLFHRNPDEHPMNAKGEVEQDTHEDIDAESGNDQQPDASGGKKGSTEASNKAIGTRQAKYGETKITDKTEKSMTNDGAKIRKQKLEKKGKDGRAN